LWLIRRFYAWHKVRPTLPELRAAASNQPQTKLAQIARFGMPGTDMPGHEYLNEPNLASVALWLKLASVQDQTLTKLTGNHE